MRARVARKTMALRLVWLSRASRSTCSIRERGKERGRFVFTRGNRVSLRLGDGGLDIDAGDACGDAGDDVAGDGVGARGDFLPRDIGPHDFCNISGLHAVHVGDIHHDLIHGHAAEDGAVGAVEVDTRAGVGEVVQVAIAKADANGGNLGGAGGDVGVVVGDTVVFREGAQEGDPAVEGEGVAQLAVVG